MTKYSLHIGINDYPGTDLDLHGCVNDARDWAELCARRGVARPTVLLDAAATKTAVLHELRRLVTMTGPGDVGIVTYSGHGSWVVDTDGDEPDGRDECWVMHDFKRDGLLTDDELYRVYVGARGGATHYLISDSCHSGTLHRAVVSPRRELARFLPPDRFMDERQQARAAKVETATAPGASRKAPVFLSGCADHEFSYDAAFNGRPNGAFTRAALDTFREGVRVGSWHGAIRRRLPTPEFPQTPQLQAGILEKWRQAL